MKYPFGIGPDYGDPKFQSYVRCVNKKLMLSTHSGSYQTTSIDHNDHVIVIAGPLMSTCNAMQNNKSFDMDWATPFWIKNYVFVLLGCSSTVTQVVLTSTVLSTPAHVSLASSSFPSILALLTSLIYQVAVLLLYQHLREPDPTNPKTWKYFSALLL